MIKVAINGFGRIGQNVFRVYSQRKDKKFKIVAMNGIPSIETAVRDLKYDSVFGRFDGEVSYEGDYLIVNGEKIKITCHFDAEDLDWSDVDVVIESTGVYRTKERAMKHIEAGAKKVIITAPASGDDKTIVMGVNDHEYDPEKHNILSNASCTTNCLAPVAKVIDEAFGIEEALMTTIHSYTNDQNILDQVHKDPRRARAGAINMIPTTTGAAKAVSLVLPQLKGKLDGMAVRVPTPTVSLVDLVVRTTKKADAEALLKELRRASENELKGILGVCEEPLVSMDFRGDSRSSIVDALSTSSIGDNFVKVISWYDNEWGYSERVVDLTEMVASKL